MRRSTSILSIKLALGFAALATLGACKGGAAMGGGGSVEPTTEDQKLYYAVGMAISRQVQVFNFKPEEMAYVVEGLRDGVAGKKPVVDMNTYGPKLNELAKKRSEARLVEEKAAATAVLDAAAKEPGAEKTASGLVVKMIKEGTGELPKATDRVKVHYHGTLRDGKVFDSSVDRKEPATFALNQVVPCWTEGVQKIKVGGKAKLTCPSSIAYGDQGRPGIPPGAVLTFEVELLSIEPPADPNAMPPGMHAIPPLGGAHGAPPASSTPPAGATPPAPPAKK